MKNIRGYEPSRQMASFCIKGFQYWDGALVLADLKVGQTLALRLEADNPYDPQAVAIYHGSSKLGYVPRELNSTYALMLYYGHDAAFETRVVEVKPDEPTYEQVRVAIYAVDARATQA